MFPRGNTSNPFVLTDIDDGGLPSAASWKAVAPFYFADGTIVAPTPLREPGDQNYLSPGVRALGLAQFGLAVLLCLVASTWVQLHRSHRIMRAYQPVFVHMMIVGAFLISIPILLNSFDEGYGWTEQQLSRACTSVPCMIIVGHLLVYSSLATKLYRINKVLQFRRRRITIKQVMWPLSLIHI